MNEIDYKVFDKIIEEAIQIKKDMENESFVSILAQLCEENELDILEIGEYIKNNKLLKQYVFNDAVSSHMIKYELKEIKF